MSRGLGIGARQLVRRCHAAALSTCVPVDLVSDADSAADPEGDGDGSGDPACCRPSEATATAMAARSGAPYVAWVTVATDHAGAPVFLFSDLAVHTRALKTDPRVALLVVDAEGGPSRRSGRSSGAGPVNPQEEDRVTLLGWLDRDPDPALRGRFLARHPYAASYAEFADFAVWRMTVTAAHRVSGFGAAAWGRDPSALLLPDQTADALAAAEPSLLTHLATNHSGLASQLARTRFGEDGQHWRIVALDADGLDLDPGPDLVSGDATARVRRVAFDRPVEEPAAVIPAAMALIQEIGL